jgi:hypothetical protein
MKSTLLSTLDGVNLYPRLSNGFNRVSTILLPDDGNSVSFRNVCFFNQDKTMETVQYRP